MRSITASIVQSFLKRRPLTAHKGTSGRVLLMAGSRPMIGAAALCGWAAVRSGAGLVRVATVESRARLVQARAPLETTTVGLPEDREGTLSSRAWPVLVKTLRAFSPDVVAFGPGVGLSRGVESVLTNLMKGPWPLVLDADALTLLARRKKRTSSHPPCIVTPHVGEISRLLGVSTDAVRANPLSAVREAAQRYRCVALLKGPGTLVSDGRQIWKNTSGNPAMASGGMGDILTGVIAALWAHEETQTEASALRSTVAGVYLHGLAGDQAVKDFPERTLLASDVAQALPDAFSIIWKQKRRTK